MEFHYLFKQTEYLTNLIYTTYMKGQIPFSKLTPIPQVWLNEIYLIFTLNQYWCLELPHLGGHTSIVNISPLRIRRLTL